MINHKITFDHIRKGNLCWTYDTTGDNDSKVHIIPVILVKRTHSYSFSDNFKTCELLVGSKIATDYWCSVGPSYENLAETFEERFRLVHKFFIFQQTIIGNSYDLMKDADQILKEYSLINKRNVK